MGCRDGNGILVGALKSSQYIVLDPYKQLSSLPRVLEVEGLEVVPQAPLPVTNDSHKAKVLELFRVIDRSRPTLHDDSHVELLDNQVYDFPGRRGLGQGDDD